MKKIKLKGKLSLNKSVISKLNTEEAEKIVGGYVTLEIKCASIKILECGFSKKDCVSKLGNCSFSPACGLDTLPIFCR